MISIITIGLISIWSVTSATGSVTYFCASRRRIQRSRSRRQITEIPVNTNDNTSTKDAKSHSRHQRHKTHKRHSSVPNVPPNQKPGPSQIIRQRNPRVKSDQSTQTLRYSYSASDVATSNGKNKKTEEKHKEEKQHSDVILYQLQSDKSDPRRVINVLDTNTDTINFKFVKPVLRLHSDNLFWNHDFYFENVNHPTNTKVASVFNANVGNGGYVEILTTNPSEGHDDSLQQTEESDPNTTVSTIYSDELGNYYEPPDTSAKSMYQSILIKFNLVDPHGTKAEVEHGEPHKNSPTKIRKMSSEYERRLSDASHLSDVNTLDLMDSYPKAGEKIHVSSKLTRDVFEFKLQKDKADCSYKWHSASGSLSRVDKNGGSQRVAYIIKGNGPRDYLIEVDRAKIDPTAALCTSIIAMSKS